MTEYFNSILETLATLNTAWVYLFLFISAILENLIPPIPGDTVTAFGAFLAARGSLNYFLVFLFTTLGSTVGFVLLFGLAKKLGRIYFVNHKNRFFKKEAILKAEVRFTKYGYYLVMINRFLPGIRSVISITAGIINLKFYKVLLLSLLSAAAWNLIWMQAGYTLGDNWESVKTSLSSLAARYNVLIGTIVLLVIVILILKRIYKRRTE